NCRKNFQCGFNETRGSVGRSARFECAAAEKFRAAALNHVRYRKRLLAIFDRTRPGDNRKRAVADARAVAKVDNRAVWPQIERDQFVRLGDTDSFRNTGKMFKMREIDRTLIDGDSDRGSVRARHYVRMEANRF